MSEDFVDYQRIVHRMSDTIATLRYEYRNDCAVGVVLELLERKYAAIIADETYSEEVEG